VVGAVMDITAAMDGAGEGAVGDMAVVGVGVMAAAGDIRPIMAMGPVGATPDIMGQVTGITGGDLAWSGRLFSFL
jgi:hypothetical protein